MLQIVVIFLTASALGRLLRLAGQPAVIGEMMAGFLLGPIALGTVFPHWHAQLFSPTVADGLRMLSELGLVLFMFLVGAELAHPQAQKMDLKSVGWVGLLSLALPFAMGVVASPWLHAQYAPADSALLPFSLLMGVLFSVTAFPVLARILQEQRLSDPRAGRMALMAAALGDVCVWVLLVVVAVVKGRSGDWHGLLMRVGLLGALCVFSFTALRPLMANYFRSAAQRGLSVHAFGLMVCGALVYASLTQALQVHAVFGAFIFGACLPRDEALHRMLSERIQPLVMVALLPCFFALAGLNTTEEAFVGKNLWTLLIVIALATSAKLLGGWIGARLAGCPSSVAAQVAVLMNTRGLMEIVVLKIGVDLGVIGQELFTIFLVMAIVTTMMTSPILNWLNRRPQPQLKRTIADGLEGEN